jgi:hypothetical protein
MAYPISFDKTTAEGFLAALQSGQPLEPPDGRWNINAMLAAAGACFFGAMSHGPLHSKIPPGAWKDLPAEHHEAREEAFFNDLHRAVDFYGKLTMAVKDGTFDDEYAPHVEAVVYRDADGDCAVHPVKGFRGYPEM